MFRLSRSTIIRWISDTKKEI